MKRIDLRGELPNPGLELLSADFRRSRGFRVSGFLAAEITGAAKSSLKLGIKLFGETNTLDALGNRPFELTV